MTPKDIFELISRLCKQDSFIQFQLRYLVQSGIRLYIDHQLMLGKSLTQSELTNGYFEKALKELEVDSKILECFHPQVYKRIAEILTVMKAEGIIVAEEEGAGRYRLAAKENGAVVPPVNPVLHARADFVKKFLNDELIEQHICGCANDSSTLVAEGLIDSYLKEVLVGNDFANDIIGCFKASVEMRILNALQLLQRFGLISVGNDFFCEDPLKISYLVNAWYQKPLLRNLQEVLRASQTNSYALAVLKLDSYLRQSQQEKRRRAMDNPVLRSSPYPSPPRKMRSITRVPLEESSSLEPTSLATRFVIPSPDRRFCFDPDRRLCFDEELGEEEFGQHLEPDGVGLEEDDLLSGLTWNLS